MSGVILTSEVRFVPAGAGLADPEIEIVMSNGDRATALDPASAIRAACELRDEAWHAAGAHQGAARGLTATFTVAGQHVRTIPVGKL